MPGRDGAYPLDEIARWLRGAWTKAAGESSKQKLEERKLQIANRRAVLKFREELGALVSRAAALAQIEQLFAALRARWESAPEELGASLPAEIRGDVVADWKSRIDLMHRELEAFALEIE